MSARLYDLIYELNLIASSVLLAVLPQLEFKLKVRKSIIELDRSKVVWELIRMRHKINGELTLTYFFTE